MSDKNDIRLTEALDIIEMTRGQMDNLRAQGLFLTHIEKGHVYTKLDYLRYWFKTYHVYFRINSPAWKIRVHHKLKL